MPELKLPLMSDGRIDEALIVYKYLWVHLFVYKGASERDVQLIRDSVSVARKILLKYELGLSVVPPGGWDDKEEIGTFSFSGPLWIDGVDQHGRLATSSSGSTLARAEVEPKITFKNNLIKPAVVLFGPSTSTAARGNTVESLVYPWFCAVGLKQAAKTTMLHEVGHCGNLQHYMANTLLSDPATKDSKNIMAEVADREADLRDRLNQQEIDLLKKAYFYYQA